MSTVLDWSPQQDAALHAVKAWIAMPKKTRPQVFHLFGYAGTGKTTLAKEIAAMVKGDVLFMCFTGKAALVLKKKGCDGASTIHSAIYKTKQDERTGTHKFRLNKDSPVRGAALVIVDEVSMVDGTVGKDLLSFNTPILVLGDPFQLPPIRGEGFFDTPKPEVLLTEIHRQAKDNPIIRLSMDVRNGMRLKPGQYGTSRIIQRADVDGEEVLKADQVLVGMNKTRQGYNRRIRQLKEFEDRFPVMGDRLVCLRNNHEKGLLNGSLWKPTKLGDSGDFIDLRVESLDDDACPEVDVNIPRQFFLGTEQDLDWRIKRENDEFTFGWALTGHKAQGSQWDNVFVVDESAVFKENAARWQYTAITRAAERVTVLID
ncbi:ATP-dependent RecD-like DNA helicase [Polaromonas sp.]|uniref:ATP-dependent DNA helicase n=1 Tax=Polaromonas sp. TaxID=1869339 RepID=UPI003264FD1D